MKGKLPRKRKLGEPCCGGATIVIIRSIKTMAEGVFEFVGDGETVSRISYLTWEKHLP